MDQLKKYFTASFSQDSSIKQIQKNDIHQDYKEQNQNELDQETVLIKNEIENNSDKMVKNFNILTENSHSRIKSNGQFNQSNGNFQEIEKDQNYENHNEWQHPFSEIQEDDYIKIKMKSRKSSQSNPLKISLDLTKIIQQRELEQAGKPVYTIIQSDFKNRSQSIKNKVNTQQSKQKINQIQKNKSVSKKEYSMSQEGSNLNKIAKINLQNTSFVNIREKLANQQQIKGNQDTQKIFDLGQIIQKDIGLKPLRNTFMNSTQKSNTKSVINQQKIQVIEKLNESKSTINQKNVTATKIEKQKAQRQSELGNSIKKIGNNIEENKINIKAAYDLALRISIQKNQNFQQNNKGINIKKPQKESQQLQSKIKVLLQSKVTPQNLNPVLRKSNDFSQFNPFSSYQKNKQAFPKKQDVNPSQRTLVQSLSVCQSPKKQNFINKKGLETTIKKSQYLSPDKKTKQQTHKIQDGQSGNLRTSQINKIHYQKNQNNYIRQNMVFSIQKDRNKKITATGQKTQKEKIEISKLANNIFTQTGKIIEQNYRRTNTTLQSPVFYKNKGQIFKSQSRISQKEGFESSMKKNQSPNKLIYQQGNTQSQKLMQKSKNLLQQKLEQMQVIKNFESQNKKQLTLSALKKNENASPGKKNKVQEESPTKSVISLTKSIDFINFNKEKYNKYIRHQTIARDDHLFKSNNSFLEKDGFNKKFNDRDSLYGCNISNSSSIIQLKKNVNRIRFLNNAQSTLSQIIPNSRKKFLNHMSSKNQYQKSILNGDDSVQNDDDDFIDPDQDLYKFPTLGQMMNQQQLSQKKNSQNQLESQNDEKNGLKKLNRILQKYNFQGELLDINENKKNEKRSLELKGGYIDKNDISQIANTVQEVDDEQSKSNYEIKDQNMFSLLVQNDGWPEQQKKNSKILQKQKSVEIKENQSQDQMNQSLKSQNSKIILKRRLTIQSQNNPNSDTQRVCLINSPILKQKNKNTLNNASSKRSFQNEKISVDDKNEESPLNDKYLNAISVNIDNDIDRFTSKLSNIQFYQNYPISSSDIYQQSQKSQKIHPVIRQRISNLQNAFQ